MSVVSVTRGGSAFLLAMVLASCSVGPGTPLLDAMRSDGRNSGGNVPAPTGYGQAGTGEASGLINPKDRKATADYLESLASE